MFGEQAVAASLRTAGIAVLDFSWPLRTLPADAAWMLTACLSEDGRVDRTFDLDEPGLVDKANEAWWQLAVEYGLLDEDRAFLVSVGPVDQKVPARPHWARVRLEEQWNVVGAGVDNGVLGGPPGRPGFVMLSLDEGVLIGGTTWQDSISIIALPNPATASAIRKFLDQRMQELLLSLAARVGVTVTDVRDEHARWRVYAPAADADDCADLLLEAVGLEPDPNVALSVVLRKLEVVPQADRQRWVDRLTGDTQRRVAARRAAELQVLETRPLAPSLGEGIEQEWSDWLQLRLAETSPEREVISRLSSAGRTRRIRRTAAERPTNLWR